MEDAWGGVDEAGLRAANPVISAILAQQPALCSVLRAPNGSDNGGCTYCAGVRNVFQLAALDGPCVCVFAQHQSEVLESLNSEGETRQWMDAEAAVGCECGWLLRTRQESVTELAPGRMRPSSASTSRTPQLAVALSCAAASTSNTKVVVQSARLSSAFTVDGKPHRHPLETDSAAVLSVAMCGCGWLVWPLCCEPR
jgi:hypothetical protein